MKIEFRRLARPVIVGMGIVAILGIVAWLNGPLRHPRTDPLQPAPAVRAETGGPPPASSSQPGSPDVNPAAFKDQGDLAFVWRDLLTIRAGDTSD